MSLPLFKIYNNTYSLKKLIFSIWAIIFLTILLGGCENVNGRVPESPKLRPKIVEERGTTEMVEVRSERQKAINGAVDNLRNKASYKSKGDYDNPFGLLTSFYPPKRDLEKLAKMRRSMRFDGRSNEKTPYETALDLGIGWERPTNPVIGWQFVQKELNTIRDFTSLTSSKLDWTIPDNFLSRVPRPLNIVVTLNVGRKVMESGKWQFSDSTGKLKELYVRFIKETVERYDGDGINDMSGLKNPVKYWQVENEPTFNPGGMKMKRSASRSSKRAETKNSKSQERYVPGIADFEQYRPLTHEERPFMGGGFAEERFISDGPPYRDMPMGPPGVVGEPPFDERFYQSPEGSGPRDFPPRDFAPPEFPPGNMDRQGFHGQGDGDYIGPEEQDQLAQRDPYFRDHYGYNREQVRRSNIPRRQGFSSGDTSIYDWQNYALLQKLTYNAIKSADPDATVISAGIYGAMVNETSKQMRAFNKFWLPFLQTLSGRYLDVFDFHWFGKWWKSKELYDKIRHALDSNGYRDVDVWMTENGSSSKKSERIQAIDLVKRMVYPLTYGVKKVFWAWGLVEGFPPFKCKTIFDYTGLIYDGYCAGDPGYGVKKLSYYTYKRLIEKLSGVDWSRTGVLSEGKKGVFVYKLEKENTFLYLIWWDSEVSGSQTPPDITLPLHVDGIYVIQEALPNYDKGKDVRNYEDNIFKSKTVQSKDKTIKLQLGEVPIYVEYNLGGGGL